MGSTFACIVTSHRKDDASYQDKRDILDILDMLAIKVTATPETVNIVGIIPLETTPAQTLDKASYPTHHWTNMGMTTWM